VFFGVVDAELTLDESLDGIINDAVIELVSSPSARI